MKFKISQHALDEIKRRGIPFPFVESVLEAPQQIVSEYGGKKAYQSQVDFGGGKIFLVRAIVDDEVEPAMVVTVYRTSKVDKYWR